MPGARRALVLLAVFSIVSFGDKAVLGLAGPRMIEDLGLTNAQFGLIGSSFYLLFSISALVLGFVGTRWPATWLLAGMVVVWSVAQLPILLPAAGHPINWSDVGRGLTFGLPKDARGNS